MAEVEEVYNQVIEAVAESDDSLMEKFFEEKNSQKKNS